MTNRVGRPPLTEAEKAARLPIRFWAKVDRSGGADACWLWTAATDNKGYAKFNYKGSMTDASRAAWELTYGIIPTGLWVCHKCDNPLCVNPTHLFLGTPKDNSQDMVKKERHSSTVHPGLRKGESNGRAKLSIADVAAIKSLKRQGYSTRQITELYGVSRSLIGQIMRGEVWSDVAV